MKKFFLLLWKGWKKFAHVLGIVNTKILLTVTYVVIIAVASLVARFARADLLDRKGRKEAPLWKERQPADVSLETCRRQF